MTPNRFVALVLGLFVCFKLSSAPDDDFLRCAIVISSVSCEEELDFLLRNLCLMLCLDAPVY